MIPFLLQNQIPGLKFYPEYGYPTWKGFSPVWTNWCRFSFELSKNAFPHSAHTWTRGPWVWRCFLIAELSRNILVHPLCGHAIVLSTPSLICFFTFILWPGLELLSTQHAIIDTATLHILRQAITHNICRYKHKYVKNTVELALLQTFLRNFHTGEGGKKKNFLNLTIILTQAFITWTNRVWRRLDFSPKESSFMATLTKNPFQVKLTNIKRYGYLTITMTNLWQWPHATDTKD